MPRLKGDVKTAHPAFEGVEGGALPVPVGAVVLGPEPETAVIFDGAAPEVFDGAVAEAVPVPVPVGPAGLPAPANCTGKSVVYCSVYYSASGPTTHMTESGTGTYCGGHASAALDASSSPVRADRTQLLPGLTVLREVPRDVAGADDVRR
jgi:hypothetical protein